jgi:MoaA/NifB/PqqE/SkfB family radical SAM enzyme
MTLENVRSIVDWASTGSIEEITLLGGEPALHRDFSSIIRMIHDRALRTRTVTNGSSHFRTAVRNPDLASSLDRVAVSLDTPSPEHFDKLRGRRAYRDAIVTVQQLGNVSIPFDINCTVVRSTLQYVPQMLSFCESLGARRLNMHWFSPVGRARKHAPEERVSAAEWRQVLAQVQAYKPRRTDYVIDCELGFSFGLPGEDLGMCAVRSRSNLQFMPDGNVFSCGMLVESPDQAGYLWRDGQLAVRRADNELSRTAQLHHGCPLREGSAKSEAEKQHAALCIYNRLARLLSTPCRASRHMHMVIRTRRREDRHRAGVGALTCSSSI